jgi:hypothetical protein
VPVENVVLDMGRKPNQVGQLIVRKGWRGMIGSDKKKYPHRHQNAIWRDAMIRSRLVSFVLGVTVGAIAGAAFVIWVLYSQRAPRWVTGAASEQPYDLWMAALKGFQGPVYYVGSEGEYSYFRAGKLFYTPYKAQTAKIHLPKTFPLNAQETYPVTAEMIIENYSR